MNSENAAFNAATYKNSKYLFFNGKKRYIEVLQCSGEEMNQILLGLVPSNLIPTNLQTQTMFSPHRGYSIDHHLLHFNVFISVPQIVPISALQPPPPQMLPTSSALPPSTNYYPMPVIYYPTQPISSSIYLQTGQIHQAPMTILLQSKFFFVFLFFFYFHSIFLGDNSQY